MLEKRRIFCFRIAESVVAMPITVRPDFHSNMLTLEGVRQRRILLGGNYFRGQ